MGLDQRRKSRLVTGAALLYEVLGRIEAQLGNGHVCSIKYYTGGRAVLTAEVATLRHALAGGAPAGSTLCGRRLQRRAAECGTRANVWSGGDGLSFGRLRRGGNDRLPGHWVARR